MTIIPHYNKYVEPTVELVLELLAEAHEKDKDLDKFLASLSIDILYEVKKELKKMAKENKLSLNTRINLNNNPAIHTLLKELEQKQIQRFAEYLWMGSKVIGESMKDTYTKTLEKTYAIFDLKKQSSINNTQRVQPIVKTTNSYLYEKVLKVPWCKDGKIYSERLYSHVSHFQQKLSYVLEEGISKGKGLDWMTEAWQKLTNATAYDTARLLKTETMAMWAKATKESYLDMGIEYVEIVGDAECGGICTEFVGEDPVSLAEAELGDLLPPYHPNCACSFVAYEGFVQEEQEQE